MELLHAQAAAAQCGHLTYPTGAGDRPEKGSPMSNADPVMAQPSRATFEVEMTRVVEVSIDMPDGHTLADCSSHRLWRWPDSVLEAIEDAVREELADESATSLLGGISEISHSDGDAATG